MVVVIVVLVVTMSTLGDVGILTVDKSVDSSLHPSTAARVTHSEKHSAITMGSVVPKSPTLTGRTPPLSRPGPKKDSGRITVRKSAPPGSVAHSAALASARAVDSTDVIHGVLTENITVLVK